MEERSHEGEDRQHRLAFIVRPARKGKLLPTGLTDVIVGGTGIFAEASGTLIGSVTATVLQSHVTLSGTITLST